MTSEQELVNALQHWLPDRSPGERLASVLKILHDVMAPGPLDGLLGDVEASLRDFDRLDATEAKRRFQQEQWAKRNRLVQGLKERALELYGKPLSLKVWRAPEPNGEVRVYFSDYGSDPAYLAYTGSTSCEPGLYGCTKILRMIMVRGKSRDEAIDALTALAADTASLPFHVSISKEDYDE
jgi:hypothetical protein